MDEILHAYDQPKLNQDEINNVNRPVVSSKTEAAIT